MIRAETSDEGSTESTSEEPAEAKASGEEKKEEPKLPSEGASDILSSPAFLKRKLEVIQKDIAQCNEDLEKSKAAVEEGKALWKDKFEALNKERANLQDRMSKQSKESEATATVEVARKLLGVLDNFDRAFMAVTPESDADKEAEEAYKKGYDAIMETLASLNVKEIETVGKEFDYELHNAVMMRPSDEYDDGYVMEELQKGFAYGEVGTDDEGNRLDGQLIRAAMVVVSA